MAVLLDMPMAGADGSTSFLDASGRMWTAHGGAQIQDNALLLNGTTAYLSASSAGWPGLPTSAKISFWINTSQIQSSGWYGIFSPTKNSNAVNNYYFEVGVIQARVCFYWAYNISEWGSSASYMYSASQPIVNDGQDHYIEIHKDGNRVTIYQDDVAVYSGTLSVPPPDFEVPGPTFTIGNQTIAGPAQWFSGRLWSLKMESKDFVATFNRSETDFSPIIIIIRDVSGFVPLLFIPIPEVNTRFVGEVQVARGVPPWWGPPGSTAQLPTYRLRGRVMQRDPDGVLDDWPLVNVRVVLFFRRLHTLVDIQRSDANGYVEFRNLMPGNQAYYGIAIDNEDPPMQNSILWDRLTPEPGA